MEAITREEKLLSGQQLEPITRKELFLAKAAGMDVETPEPITREEIFLSQISGGGGGTIEPLSVTANGTYNPPEGVDGYSPVTVNVAGSGGDEWKEQFIAAIERDDSKPVTRLPDGLTKIGASTFSGSGAITVTSVPSGVEKIEYQAFSSCYNLVNISLPDGLKQIESEAFAYCYALSSVTFKGKATTISSRIFVNCNNLLTINVPWAEGEVSGAPWGATQATINYNYTGG